MYIIAQKIRKKVFARIAVCLTLVSFIFSLVTPLPIFAQNLSSGQTGSLFLPNPGMMIAPTSAYMPPMLKGMKIGLEDPFAFDFILDSGNAELTQEELKQEANKLIKYFLASLTIPEDDLWVNLSPYEKDRIIPDEFGITEMGRDLLAQDYILKQFTASLIYPEEELGEEFWNRVYSKARQLYGTEEIPINTFNKVWILPDKAVVFQNQDIAFVLESHLKVMLEADYLALKSNLANKDIGTDQLQDQEIEELNNISSQLIKEVVIPEIEKEVNQGQNFAKLRQVYHSLILAKWYKQNLKRSILNREYSDQKKIVGVDVDDKLVKEKIYEQYLEAFKKGVFDYIKEDYDTATQQLIPRKYFSGGLELIVPLEVETDPVQLAKAETIGKLSWIKGIYRQPRVSARHINGLFGDEIKEGRAQKVDPIEYEGTETTTYEIPVPLEKAGQYGHIGLGEKEIKDGEVVYKNDGDVVVYLLKEAANNSVVRNHEGFKAQRIREKMRSLGEERGLDRRLTATEMRLWIQENVNGEARAFLREIDREAESRYSLEPLYSKAEEENRLPSDEFIAETYREAEDFRDLNLAAGRTVTNEDLRQVPTDVLQNTSAILEKILLFVKRLENPDSDMRVSGIHALGLLMEKGIADEKIIREMKFVEKLVTALGDGDSYVRAAAAQALGNGVTQWGELAREIIPALVTALGDGDSDVRAAAAQALGNGVTQWGELAREIIPALVTALGDGYSYVRAAAAQALGNGVTQGGELAREIIPALVTALGDGDSDVRAAAAQALGNGVTQWGELAREIIPALVTALGDGESWRVRAAAAQALGNGVTQGGELAREIIPALVTALGDGDSDVRAAAAQALGNGVTQWGELAREIIPALVTALGDGESWRVRAAAAQALGNGVTQGGELAREIIPALVTALGDGESWRVRAAAAQALGNGVTQGGELAREIIPALVTALGDGYSYVRAAAAQALGNGVTQWGELAREIIPALVTALGDGDSYVRAAAAQALGNGVTQWGELAREIIPALVTALGDGDSDVRAAAAQALGNGVTQWGELAREIIPALVTALGDGYSYVRAAAAQALGNGVTQGGELAREIIPALVTALGDGDSDVRAAAAQALGNGVTQWGELAREIIPALVTALGDGYSYVRAAAAQALGNGVTQWGELAREIIPALVTALGDGDSYVRAAAAQALGNGVTQWGELAREIIPALVTALGDGDSDVRAAAAQALGNGVTQWGELAREIIPALVTALGDGDSYVRAAAAQALGNGVTQGGELAREIIPALVTALGDGYSYVRAAAAQALGNGVTQGGELAREIIPALVTALGDGYSYVRAAAAQALGNGVTQWGELAREIIPALVTALGDGDSYVRAAAAQALGNGVTQGGELAREIIPALVTALGDGYSYVRAAAAQALGNGVTQWGELAREIIPALVTALGDGDSDVRAAAAQALGNGVTQWGELAREIIPALVTALGDGYSYVRAAAAQALGNGVTQGGELAREIIPALVTALGDGDSDVRAAAAQALGNGVTQWGELAREIIPALVTALGDGDSDVRAAAAQALGNEVEQGRLGILSTEKISDYYSLLQEERKSQGKVSADDDVNSRQALILKVHSIIEGKVDPDDVKYVGQIADVTEDRDSLRVTLDTIRGWAVDGSSDAQNFLEGRVGQIASRNPKNDEDYVETNEKDDVYIEATAGSFRQRSLLPIFTDKKFHPRVRARVMKSLAESGYIDSGYAKIRESDVARYLDLISEVYDEFNLIAPKILIENLIDQETTIDSLKAVKPRLEEIIAKRDYRILIKELSQSEEMMFAYYMLQQSPFQYQGTDPISYERFRKLVKASAESLDDEETDMVEVRLKNGFIAAGLDDERALQIAQAILQGRPPLPRGSPYLDEDGNFIPQKVDVLSTLGDSDAPREAQNSFNSSLNNIVLVLRINDLMSRIPKGIEKRFKDDEKGKTDMEKQYKWVVGGIRLGVDLTKILNELKELNDKIFPPHGRKRDLDVMVAQSVNKQIRNTPMHQDIISTLGAKKKDEQADQKRTYLEDFDINGLVRNLDKMVNALKSKQKSKKLTSIERQIIKEDEINGGHVIRIFFANLLQRAQLGKKHPLYAIFQDLEAHLIAAFDNYVQAVSAKVDIRNVPQVVYVDFVSKFNLMEFFRFSDGAHCCLASDPNVSSQYGAGIYEREMPRYLTNATSFWWQFTTDVRSGKQIGWFENWFGVNESDGDKVFVGTELTYISPGHHDRDLQTALLAQVERILFSTKVTKVAQANFGHHAANAMSPPGSYREETMNITKLQSLRDGTPIYEDADVATNMSSTHSFHVKDNPGDVEVEAAVEVDRYNVSAEFVQPSEVTEDLIQRLLRIEEEVFPEDKLGGEDYMREQLDSPNVLIAVYKDEDSEDIVGYRYAVPATEALNMPEASEYNDYRTEEVLYGADVAIQPKYWGKADMGEKFQAFFRRAKEEGYKHFAVHTESVNSVRPGASLSEKYQGMGFEVKLKEQDWGDTGDEYDFLVLDLSTVDSAMLGDVATSSPVQNPGGIDFNLDLLELEIQGQGRDFNLPNLDRSFEHIRIDNGLLPIIINITPIVNLPLLLGQQNEQNNEVNDLDMTGRRHPDVTPDFLRYTSLN